MCTIVQKNQAPKHQLRTPWNESFLLHISQLILQEDFYYMPLQTIYKKSYSKFGLLLFLYINEVTIILGKVFCKEEVDVKHYDWELLKKYIEKRTYFFSMKISLNFIMVFKINYIMKSNNVQIIVYVSCGTHVFIGVHHAMAKSCDMYATWDFSSYMFHFNFKASKNRCGSLHLSSTTSQTPPIKEKLYN